MKCGEYSKLPDGQYYLVENDDIYHIKIETKYNGNRSILLLNANGLISNRLHPIRNSFIPANGFFMVANEYSIFSSFDEAKDYLLVK